jgi:hypothetical protein
MQVKVTVVVDVEAVKDPAILTCKAHVLESVQEAIHHAVKYGEGEGFVHSLDNELALSIVSVGPVIDVDEKPVASIMLAALRRAVDWTSNEDERADWIREAESAIEQAENQGIE